MSQTERNSFRKYLGLDGQENRVAWLEVQIVIERAIEECMDVSAPVPGTRRRQPQNIERAIDMILERQARYFPDPEKRKYEYRKNLAGYITGRFFNLRKTLGRGRSTPSPIRRGGRTSRAHGARANASPSQALTRGDTEMPIWTEMVGSLEEEERKNAVPQLQPKELPLLGPFTNISQSIPRDQQAADDSRGPASSIVTATAPPMVSTSSQVSQGQGVERHLVEHLGDESLQTFLARCQPSVAHLQPILVAAGWKNMGVVKALSKWPKDWLSGAVQAGKNQFESGRLAIPEEYVSPTTLDWCVFEYHVWKFGHE